MLENKQYQTFLSFPSYQKRQIRKSTAGFVLATTDFGLNNENEILKRAGWNLKKCNCEPNLFSGFENVSVKEVNEYETTKHLSNVLHCGSPWTCPVCSAKISTVKANEINNLMKIGKANKRFYSLVVLTIPHQAGQSLEELDFILSILRKKLQEHKDFRKFKKKYKLRFVGTGLELMMSIKNNLGDFHPHINFVFDFDEDPQITELELSKKIYDIVTKILQPKKFDLIKSNTKTIRFEFIKRKHNLTLKEPYAKNKKKLIKFSDGGQVLKEFTQIKGGVSATYNFKEDYPTKFGLGEEATMSFNKGTDITKSFHPFQALDFIRFFDLEDNKKKLLIEMFREYVKTFKGKSLFRFGRAAQEYYNKNYQPIEDLKEKTETEIMQEEEAKGVSILDIPNLVWKKFNPTPIQVLILFNKETPKDMEDYIESQISKDDFKREKEFLEEAHEKTQVQKDKSLKKTIEKISKKQIEKIQEIESKKEIQKICKEKQPKITYLDVNGMVIKPSVLGNNPNSIPIPKLTNLELFAYIQDLINHLDNPFLKDFELEIIKDKLYYAERVFVDRGFYLEKHNSI